MTERFKPGDRVEDFEGDKATVREVNDGRIVAVEWDCRLGVIARPHPSYIDGAFTPLDRET